MKTVIATAVSIAILISMTYFGKQGYLAAKQYERIVYELTQQMDIGALVEAQTKEWVSLFTLGLVKNNFKERMHNLEKKRQMYAATSKKYALYFAVLAAMTLFLFFLFSLNGFTIVVLLAALISLISGLITPTLMVIIHKNVEYLGDVVFSFESRSIIGSISKLYTDDSLVVAGVILLFSIVLPLFKIISMLFVSIFGYSRFVTKVVVFLKHLGKWSMIDIFVVAILLVYLTGESSDANSTEIEIGFYFFLIYVILSMIASVSIRSKR